MILTNKDLQKYYQCSANTAVARRKELQAFAKSPSGRITTTHLATYEGENIETVVQIITK